MKCAVDTCGDNKGATTILCYIHHQQFNIEDDCNMDDWIAYKNGQRNTTVCKKSTAHKMFDRAQKAKDKNDREKESNSEMLYNRYVAHIIKMADTGVFHITMQSLKEQVSAPNTYDLALVLKLFQDNGFSLTAGNVCWGKHALSGKYKAPNA